MSSEAPAAPAAAAPNSLEALSRKVLEANWISAGYTCPNPGRYAWQWLWDSCFHAIVWAHLGRGDKALTEMTTLLDCLEPSGFLPHMNYLTDPSVAKDFWGRDGTSNITQPPMFGHALAELKRRGAAVPDELVEKAVRGLMFFVERRVHGASGLLRICHPWESGADNNPRWDGYYQLPYGHEGWQDEKIGMLKFMELDADGAAQFNPAFAATSVAFTALTVFNMDELNAEFGGIERSAIDGLVEAVENAWDDGHATWADHSDPEIDTDVAAPVLDALLCIFADRSEERLHQAAAQLLDPTRFGGDFGPASVAKDYPGYDGDGYWRGSAWPHLSYLTCVALRRRNLTAEADTIAKQLRAGALKSGFSEYWNPDTAKPGGAVPQSWTTLAAVV